MVDQPTSSPTMSHLLNASADDPKDEYCDPTSFECTPPTLINKHKDTVYSNRSSQKIVRSLRRDSGIFSHEVYYYEPVAENEFDNLQRKYGELSGEIVTVEIVLQDIEELIKTTKARGLGISLCGNRDLNQMAVLVCGLRPGGIADLDGRIIVGDQLLELNDHVLYGRSHLNAAPIILSSYSSMLNKAADRNKQGSSQALRFVIRRLPENLTNLACPPITYPSMSQESSRKSSAETAPTASSIASQQLDTPGFPAPGRSVYEEVHVARLLRGKNGFGFAIMDKSFTNEPGIYIKQLVENGPAMLNGTLRAGDRIIRVDWHDALHANYESVLEWLRSAKHQVRIVVSRVRLGSRTQMPSDDTALKLGLRKRLSVPALSSLLSAFIHHSSKKTSMQSTSSGEPSLVSNSLGDEMPPKKLDLLSPDIVSLDLRRASCPEQFAPGFAKKLAGRSFLGVVPMASLTQLADPPLIVSPLGSGHGRGGGGGGGGGGDGSGSKMCADATRWGGISAARNAPKNTAARRPILPGQENYIEIARNLAPGLGVSLIGGFETSLGVLQIHEIFPEGVLAKDGRLQPGDRIIAVNHQRLSKMSFENAVSTIVHAFSGLQPVASDADLATLATRTATSPNNSNNPGSRGDSYVSLVVERPAGVQTKWYDQEVTVDLLKRPGRGLGICIVERTGPVSRTVQAIGGGGGGVCDGQANIATGTSAGSEKPAIAPPHNGLTSGSRAGGDQAGPTETTSLGVIISDLIKGSIAHTDGRIMLGDQILSINDIDVQNSSQEEVATLLKAAQGKITLRLGRLKNQTRLLSAASAFVCCQRQLKKDAS